MFFNLNTNAVIFSSKTLFFAQTFHQTSTPTPNMNKYPIKLDSGNKHIEKITRSTAENAIAEIIWNSLDADADNIDLKINYDGLGNIEYITISDDGCGLPFDEFKNNYCQLGFSMKPVSKKTPKFGLLHGKKGEGKFKILSSVAQVEIKSVYQKDGALYEYDISEDNSDLSQFLASEEVKSNASTTGFSVTLKGIDQKKFSSFLNTSEVVKLLGLKFAHYLYTYAKQDINIVVDGVRLKYDNFIERIENKFIICQGIQHEITLIEWQPKIIQKAADQNLSLGRLDGIIHDMLLIKVKPPITAFVFSDAIDSYYEADGGIGMLHREVLDEIKIKAMDVVKAFAKEVVAHNSLEIIDALKKEAIYPNDDDMESDVHKELMAACAVEIIEKYPNFQKKKPVDKKIMLLLVKQALSGNNQDLSKILYDIFQLNRESTTELAKILEDTSLRQMINTITVLIERIKFVEHLRTILYENYDDQQVGNRMSERTQLHKIIGLNIWIFGEEYALSSSDTGFKDAIKKALEKVNKDAQLVSDDEDFGEGSQRRPDLCLCRCIPKEEFLLIELKRPNIACGKKELRQVEDYADIILENRKMKATFSKFTFILMTIEKDDSLANYKDRITDLHSIKVVLWSDLLDELAAKLKSMKEMLSLQIQTNQAFTFFRTHYSEYFPIEIGEPSTPNSGS